MHPAEPADELLQCYDEYGAPIEARPRVEVKRLPPRWWYATSKVWLVNDRAELIVSKRSESLAGSPGKWQTYFGGHVSAGLSIKESALKELAEESGLRVSLNDLYFINAGKNPETKVHYEFYAVRFNGTPSDLHFTDGEITEAKWMSMEAYERERATNPDAWCCGITKEQQETVRRWMTNGV